ncbi:retrovirus-related pol polyprotein from transposon TNT 1-94 [Tanacetum coccineum]|uniref:Retrovirus-related pol polyprotein from transposon TNT 1-94 n=1 Tax=Tanacetum coccineum TaxID=301880 RepID=A0ABQ4WEB9_9ASTR
MKVEESLNVTSDESPPPTKLSLLVDDDVGEEEAIKNNTKVVNNNNEEDESIEVDEVINIKESKNHPLEQNLVPLPLSQFIIGTKWVFRNKLDENGIVSRNKARLVAQGYNQQEGIDYDETYAPVARLESIRILLAIACANDFKLSQMDVQSAFLNGFINEEVYVAQPLGFIDYQKPNYAYKFKKALYGLKQALKAWFTFHERVMDPLDMSRNPSKEKGKKISTPSVTSSSSSSSDDNEAPSFLEFYDELSDNEDLTKAQQEKRGMFKCLNRYVGTITKYLKKQE